MGGPFLEPLAQFWRGCACAALSVSPYDGLSSPFKRNLCAWARTESIQIAPLK